MDAIIGALIGVLSSHLPELLCKKQKEGGGVITPPVETKKSFTERLTIVIRPFVTLTMVLFFISIKLIVVILLLQESTLPLKDKIPLMWSGADEGIMSFVIAYWFGRRSVFKNGNGIGSNGNAR